MIISSSAHAAQPEVLPQPALEHSPILDMARGAAGFGKLNSTAPLTYHGGPVMSSAVTVTPIFWGQKWKYDTSDKKTGLSIFYKGYGRSNYAAISSQYGTPPSTSSTSYTTSIVTSGDGVQDFSRASSNTKAVMNEVVTAIGASQLANDGYYPVYTDLPRGSAGYCAWHSAASITVSGKTIYFKFAFFFNLDGDTGCAAPVYGTHSPGLSALANVSAHELAETMTDPLLNAWYDNVGYENGDKCAWNFGSSPVTLSNESVWFLQGEWDNVRTSCQWG